MTASPMPATRPATTETEPLPTRSDRPGVGRSAIGPKSPPLVSLVIRAVAARQLYQGAIAAMDAEPGWLRGQHGRLAVRAQRGREPRRRSRPGSGQAAPLVSGLGAQSLCGFSPSDRLCCETMTLRESV